MARYERSYTGERRTAFLGVQLTPTERDELEAAADLAGAPSLSEFARELLFRRLGRPGTVAGTRRDPQTAALMQALDGAAYQHGAAGNLLNQLMRHAHTTGELGERRVAELDELIALFRKATELHIAALDQLLDQQALGRAAA
jgi:hypothetical protein